MGGIDIMRALEMNGLDQRKEVKFYKDIGQFDESPIGLYSDSEECSYCSSYDDSHSDEELTKDDLDNGGGDDQNEITDYIDLNTELKVFALS
jgi:hypothetical protein